MKRLPLVLALAALFTVTTPPAGAVTSNQLDDFQDGTSQGWGSGPTNPNPPVNISDVGPAGLGDHSLQITSTGIPFAGGRFVAFNTTQWTGDFSAAGVERIVMDVNNIGSVTLNMRVALDGAGGRFVTTLSVPVLAGSGWQSLAFSIAPGDLTSAGGLGVGATLAAVTSLRVISAASPTFQGDVITAQGLIDNVAPCLDIDGDGFGIGAGCVGPDVHDAATSCTDDGSDSDGDAAVDCLDLCFDEDGDEYGVDLSAVVIGSGSIPVGACTLDGFTPCPFLDSVCNGPDCDDSDPNANVECSEPVPSMTPWGTAFLGLVILMAALRLGLKARRAI